VNVLTSLMTVSFSRRTLLREVSYGSLYNITLHNTSHMDDIFHPYSLEFQCPKASSITTHEGNAQHWARLQQPIQKWMRLHNIACMNCLVTWKVLLLADAWSPIASRILNLGTKKRRWVVRIAPRTFHLRGKSPRNPLGKIKNGNKHIWNCA